MVKYDVNIVILLECVRGYHYKHITKHLLYEKVLVGHATKTLHLVTTNQHLTPHTYRERENEIKKKTEKTEDGCLPPREKQCAPMTTPGHDDGDGGGDMMVTPATMVISETTMKASAMTTAATIFVAEIQSIPDSPTT